MADALRLKRQTAALLTMHRFVMLKCQMAAMHRFGMQVSFFSCTVHGEQVCEFRKLVLSGQITFLFVCIRKNVLFTGASRESPNTQPRDLLNISSLNYICYALICTTGLIKDRLLITSLPCIQTGVHWGIVTQPGGIYTVAHATLCLCC